MYEPASTVRTDRGSLALNIPPALLPQGIHQNIDSRDFFILFSVHTIVYSIPDVKKALGIGLYMTNMAYLYSLSIPCLFLVCIPCLFLAYIPVLILSLSLPIPLYPVCISVYSYSLFPAFPSLGIILPAFLPIPYTFL
jgi:hypothetical protein